MPVEVRAELTGRTAIPRRVSGQRVNEVSGAERTEEETI
jgi:hypothetical protein